LSLSKIIQVWEKRQVLVHKDLKVLPFLSLPLNPFRGLNGHHFLITFMERRERNLFDFVVLERLKRFGVCRLWERQRAVLK